MANTKFLAQIRKQMEQLKSEYATLSEAYNLLSQVSTGRGRKPSVNLITAIDSSVPAKASKRKGKRGRPPGAKNKPGYRKPGPKAVKAVKAVKADKPVKSESKSVAKKGRPRKSTRKVVAKKVEQPIAQ